MNDVTDTASPDTGRANTKVSTAVARTDSIEQLATARGVGERNTPAATTNTAAAHSAPATATLGGLLQASRIARSLSLDEVSVQINIAAQHLAALEGDKKIALPQTFITGYAKSYARFLGIEPEFLNKFFAVTVASSNAGSSSGGHNLANTSSPANGGSALKKFIPARAIANPLAGEAKPVAPRAVVPATPRSVGKVTSSIRKSSGFRSGSSWSSGLFGSPMGLLRVATTTTLPLLGLCVLAFAYHTIDSQFSDASRISASSHSLGQAPDQLGVLAHEALTAQLAQSEGRQPAARAGQARLANAAALQPVLVAAEAVSVAEAVGREQNILLNTMQSTPTGSFQIDRPAAIPAATIQVSAPTRGLVAAVAIPATLESLSTQAYPTQTARSVVPNTNIRDMHEPVGPGAVGMIAQLNMQDRLVIQVYEDSWVDVSDSSGNKLYRDLARAGRKIDVSGQLPFSLHLGNAPGLELELNGESIAITRYRSDNSARLTLASN